MILIQEYFVPEKISEAWKLTILRPGQAAVPVPSDGRILQHRMSGRLLPLLVFRLSPHAETSPRGPQIETFGNGFKSLGLLSSFILKVLRQSANTLPTR